MRSVSIIVPCRNERRHIEAFLASVEEQQLDEFEWEAIIADGKSDDGTREIVGRFCQRNGRLRVIDNPGETVSRGLNEAIRQARGEIIVRMDVHAEYSSNYVRECIAVLEETGAANVGGALRAMGGGLRQRVFAAAVHSPFAAGGARSRNRDYEGEVDTITYGCWRKETLEIMGGFDVDLVRNQDDELNFRIVRSGKTIWQSKRIVSWYHPRTNIRLLFQQYFQYGYWKVPVILKHGAPARWRHLAPGAFVAALLALIGGTAVGAAAGVWELEVACGAAICAALAAYSIASAAAAVHAARSHGWAVAPFLPFLFPVYHFGYGTGFLLGLAAYRRGRPPVSAARPIFSALTR